MARADLACALRRAGTLALPLDGVPGRDESRRCAPAPARRSRRRRDEPRRATGADTCPNCRGRSDVRHVVQRSDSGSDLASIRTTAVRDGGEWVINGQKILTTTYWGDYDGLAARTDPAAKPPTRDQHVRRRSTPRHHAPADQDDVRRRVLATRSSTKFASRSTRWWASRAELEILVGSLGTERAFVGAHPDEARAPVRELCETVAGSRSTASRCGLDPSGARSARRLRAAQIEGWLGICVASRRILARGDMPTWEAAVMKVFAGELDGAIPRVGPRHPRHAATLSANAAGAPMGGRLSSTAHSLMWVISIGTNEIQRSLIAQRAGPAQIAKETFEREFGPANPTRWKACASSTSPS